MTKRLLSEDATFAGDWWIPAGDVEGAAPIAGTLSWKAGSAVLDLHDSFTPLRSGPLDMDPERHSIVYGRTTGCELVTVLDAWRTLRNMSFGAAGFRRQDRLTATLLIVGDHLGAETKYTEVRVRIPGLSIWLERHGGQMNFIKPDGGRLRSIEYRFEPMSEEIFPIAAMGGKLGLGLDRSFSGDLATEISVKTSACLRFVPDDPQRLEWFFEQLNKASTLLSLLAGSPMGAVEIKAKVAGSGVEVDVLVGLRHDKRCEFSTLHDFFMRRPGMGLDVSLAFENWFAVYEHIAMPVQLAQSILLSDELWSHVEFLSLMQALEGLHRATEPGLYMASEEYKAVEAALIGALPQGLSPAHRQSLKSRIRYGNEVSLRKRLDVLVKRLSTELKTVLIHRSGEIPTKWVDTRNFYTHWDEASRKNVLAPVDMHYACVRMRLLVRALLLKVAGVGDDAIVHSLKGAHRESQYLMQLNSRP